MTPYHWIALVAAGAGLSACSETERSDEVLFSVAVTDLPATINNKLAQGHGLEDTLELRLRGEVFDPPHISEIVAHGTVDRSTALSASDADLWAFKTFNQAWIIETFAASDTAEIRDFLSDPNVRAGSRALYQRIERQDVFAVAEYQADSSDYRLVFLNHYEEPRRGKANVYVLEHGEWKRTNRLSRDSTLWLALLAFRRGSVTQR